MLGLASTTVEIILYYLTGYLLRAIDDIYNSRNYSILLNIAGFVIWFISTTVEIILYYLTVCLIEFGILSTTVEIILYYLTAFCIDFSVRIYNSRNYSILLNFMKKTATDVSTTVEIILYYLTEVIRLAKL